MKTLYLMLFMITGLNSLHAQHETFYVGHSGFGWDLIVGEMVNDLATDAGIITYDYDYQFIGGTCLSDQWMSSAAPQGGVSAVDELPNGYDILVLAEQIPISEVIYSSPWGCDLTSVQAVDSFYDITVNANPDARIYLMELHNEVDLTGPTPFDTWSTLNTDMRPLWEQVADSVGLINPGGPSVCIVPVAAAFEAMVDSINDGVFPGYTDWLEVFDPADIPEATIHPTEQTYYLLACVHYACIFGESPVGLTNITTAAAGWDFDPPSTAQALMMQEIAWEIVSNDPYSCLPTPASIENSPELDFGVYPNPSEGVVNLDFGSQSSGVLEVIDVFGKTVQREEVLQNSIQLDLNSGIYFLRLTTQDGDSRCKRLIVNQ